METIERLWREMEKESGASWLMRLSRGDGRNPLFIALEPQQGSRCFFLPVPSLVLPPRREWPECRGLEWLTLELEGVIYWGVRLRDKVCSEVFTALAHDLDHRLSLLESTEQAVAELYRRLRLWQQFLKAWQDGLGLEAARGLWGEIHFLHNWLLNAFDAEVALKAWTAGTRAHQDFQFINASVEVKTTAAKQPQSVRITSERQLDETGVGSLFLVVLTVDDREVATSGNAGGMSLPKIIETVRNSLSRNPSALMLFNDLLLQRGWMDDFARKHELRCLTIRDELVFNVQPGFPRLIETDLPTGVGDVNYALTLSSCDSFRISRTNLLEMLAASLKNY